jgi:simple sugar transport system permease protein
VVLDKCGPSTYHLQVVVGLNFLSVVVLGGVNPMGGFGTVTGVVLATLVLQMVASGFNALRFSQFFYLAAQGGVLVLVMILNTLLENRRTRKSVIRFLSKQ